MTLERTEQGLDETPRRFGEPVVLRVLDVRKADEPSFGRDQQAGSLLAGRQIEDDAPDYSLRVVVGMSAPDLRQAADLQGKVEQAILEVLDPRQIGEPATVGDGDAHDCRIRNLERKSCFDDGFTTWQTGWAPGRARARSHPDRRS